MPRRPACPTSSLKAVDPQSAIKILISTDNHLGYLERDPVRGDDSFRSFEEVLEIAKANKVDMVLFGGDLFHDNKPSRSTLVKTMRILRSACLSPAGEIHLAVLTDPSQVNYMRPTVAVSLPVFVIHGNHDDPTGAAGPDALSALDVLAEAGLITYFGRISSTKQINVAPILLQKGYTRLALYGLGNIRDELLYDTWAKAKRFKWLSPSENPVRDRSDDRSNDEGNRDSMRWFNLFVLHQNRVTRGSSRGISDTLLPPWLDYVVWGHEHDSLPNLTHTSPPVVQPGSTVATSLSPGEAKPKHAILVEVNRGMQKHRIIPLLTTRNFNFHDVRLSEQDLPDTDAAKVKEFLDATVDDLIEEMETEYDKKLASIRNGTFEGVHDDVLYPPTEFYERKLTRLVRQPLIRLRVEITGNWELPNPQRFGHPRVGRAANPADILLFYRSKRRVLKTTRSFLSGEIADEAAMGEDGAVFADETADGVGLAQDGAEQRDVVQIPKLTQYYLYHRQAGGTGLKFLELDKLTCAVDDFVTKMEPKAITDYVTSYIKVQQDKTLGESKSLESGYDQAKVLELFEVHAKEAAKRALIDTKQTDGNALVAKETKKSTEQKPAVMQSKVKQKLVADFSEVVAEVQEEEQEEEAAQAANSTKDREELRKSKNGDDNQQDDLLEGLDAVHAVLTANPRLAEVLGNRQQALQSLNISDESDEDDSDGAVAPATPARGRGRGRGRGSTRGRGRGRGRTSAASASASHVGMRSARRAAGVAARRTASMLGNDSDEIGRGGQSQRRGRGADDEVEEDAIEEMDVVEYVPVASGSRRRRAAAPASGTRASQRSRVEAANNSMASSGRRSAFSNRARLRRNTGPIDVDEESGDDAM